MSDRATAGAVLTLAWYAVVLAVVFTTAFWLGRVLGPTPVEAEQPPTAPHTPAGGH